MRIACLHIPQFALQCATRLDQSLRGAAVVVVGARDPRAGDRIARVALHSPIVQACSRAAWGMGARVGMTATAARALSPDLKVVTADALLERETVRGLADVLLALSPLVDVGGRIGAGAAHLAMYCEVPSKTRGTSFGDRVLEKLETFGLTARIGIADDRFTAWVAASSERRIDRLADDDGGVVVSVPRGGSAAFLAPRPLSLLAISPEVQHMLEALGVSTLGEFAALPAPSVARPLEADYQALARGESGTVLRAYAPDAPIREEVAIAAPLSVSAATAVLAERIALRLAGRGRGAARLELLVSGEAGERTTPIVVGRAPVKSLESFLTPPSSVIASAEQLAETIGSGLQDADRSAWRMRVVVVGEALAGDDQAETQILRNDDENTPAIVDTLSVVLSNSGSLDLAFGPSAFALTGASPAREHRRTRRGKQRRRSETLIQPRLFKTQY